MNLSLKKCEKLEIMSKTWLQQKLMQVSFLSPKPCLLAGLIYHMHHQDWDLFLYWQIYIFAWLHECLISRNQAEDLTLGQSEILHVLSFCSWGGDRRGIWDNLSTSRISDFQFDLYSIVQHILPIFQYSIVWCTDCEQKCRIVSQVSRCPHINFGLQSHRFCFQIQPKEF